MDLSSRTRRNGGTFALFRLDVLRGLQQPVASGIDVAESGNLTVIASQKTLDETVAAAADTDGGEADAFTRGPGAGNRLEADCEGTHPEDRAAGCMEKSSPLYLVLCVHKSILLLVF